MFYRKYFCSVVLICLFGLNQISHAADCGLSEAFKQKDGNAKSGQTSVWSDKSGKSLLFIESLDVNTDGTTRSYSVSDFWGEETAINNLCNAMSDACAKLSKNELRDRRILTQKAYAEGWPKDKLALTKISPFIIPFRDKKPCPLVDGYMVSATALHNKNISNVCDIKNYVNALITPALVIPENPSKLELSQFSKRGAKVGDLVVAIVPGSSDPVFGVVGDSGPAGKLGEASVAMNGKLLGKTSLPINYRHVIGKGEYKGQSWLVSEAAVLIFPNTKNLDNPYMTPERIDVAGKQIFETWGGVSRLNACISEYRPSHTKSAKPTGSSEPENSYSIWAVNNEKLDTFKAFLSKNQLQNIAPYEHLLRTATKWNVCKAAEYEVPPQSQWNHVLSTLKLLEHLKNKDVIGNFEIASAYRNPTLNKCAGGSPKSSHRVAYAIDFIPSKKTDDLCNFWKTQGSQWNMGLSKYSSGRVHIDANGYRTWGNDYTKKSSFCK